MMYEATFYNYNQTRDICQALFELQRSSDSSCDVSLFIDHGQEIRVHGIIFAASSNVLRDLLLTNRRESEFTKTLNVAGISCDALQILIKYLYTGELCMTVDSVGEILRKCTDWKLSFVEEKCNCFVKSHYPSSSAGLDLDFQSSNCSAERVGNSGRNLLQLRNNDTLLPNNDCSEIALSHDSSSEDQALLEIELCSKRRYPGKKIYRSSSGEPEPPRNSENTNSTCSVRNEPANCLNTESVQSGIQKILQQQNSCKYRDTSENLTYDTLPSCNTCKKTERLKDAAVEETASFMASPPVESSVIIDDDSLSLLQKSGDKFVSQKSLQVSTEISTSNEHGPFLVDPNMSPRCTVVNKNLSDKVLLGNHANIQDDFVCDAERMAYVKKKTKKKPEYQKKFNASNNSQLKPENKLEEESCYAPRHPMDNFEQQAHFNEGSRESQQTGAKTKDSDKDFSVTNVDLSNAGTKTVNMHNSSCSECHRNFSTAAGLVQRLHQCVKSKRMKRTLMYRRLYNCTECSFRSSRGQAYLDEHMFKKHNKPVGSNLKFLMCRVSGCDYQTLQPKLLSLHMNRHRSEKPFICEECGARLKSEGILVRHMKLHKNISKTSFRCSECGNSLCSKMSLKLHVRRLHQRQLNFLCANCPYRAFSKDALESHQFSLHGICPPSREIHSCQHCDWKTLIKSHLKRHLQRHIGEKRHECLTCHSRFIDVAELRSHEKRHFKDAQRVHCTFAGCSHTEFTKHKLDEHIRMAHTHKGEKPWKCKLCDHCTALKGNLTKHLRTVHKVEVITKQKRLARVNGCEISDEMDLSPTKDGGNTERTLNLMSVGMPGSELTDVTRISSSDNTETGTVHTPLSSEYLIVPPYANRTLPYGQLNDSFGSVAVNLSQLPNKHGVSGLHITSHSVQFGFGTSHHSSSDIYNPGQRTERDQPTALPLSSPHP